MFLLTSKLSVIHEGVKINPEGREELDGVNDDGGGGGKS